MESKKKVSSLALFMRPNNISPNSSITTGLLASETRPVVVDVLAGNKRFRHLLLYHERRLAGVDGGLLESTLDDLCLFLEDFTVDEL